MTRVLPRRQAHRGHVEASALLIEATVVGEDPARARVLALWSAGTEVRRLPDGSRMLRLAPPRRIDARTSLGTPLVQRDGCWMSAPLSDAEWKALQPPTGAIVVSRAGAVVVVSAAETTVEDPSTWLDLSELTLAALVPFGAPPPSPEAAIEPVQDVRAALGGKIPAAAPERAELLAALRQATAAGTQSASAPQPGVLGRALRWLSESLRGGATTQPGAQLARAAPPGALQRALRWLSKALQGSGATGGSATSAPPVSAGPPSDSWWQRAARRLERWAFALTDLSGLSRLLGRRQAQYLGKLLDLFEERDLTEALRHAIPLGDGKDASEPTPMWGVPSRRDELRITPGQLSSGGGSLGVGPNLYEHLRQLYRQAVAKLERLGQLEEAAFVLAELLRASEEAVSFLERHGKLREAAALAESRNLKPGLIVRQWFLAKDYERGIEMARRHNAYADAIVRLHPSHPEEAAKLRLLWANTLADAGHFGQAADVIWLVPDARRLGDVWMDRAIALGGPSGARALVRKLSLRPQAFEEVRTAALELLADTSADRLAERLAFASELATQLPPTSTPASDPALPLRTLGRAALRTLVRDSGLFGGAIAQWEVEKLTKHVGDAALVADLPKLPLAGRAMQDALPERIRVTANDLGTLPISDAALLPNGRVLVALGEAGVRVLTRDGRLVRHLDVPADALAVAQNGARAIALATRGDVQRLSRIDLVELTAQIWCDAELTHWTDSYDGDRWFVANDKRIVALDALAPGLKALWQIPDRMLIMAMSRPASRFSFVVADNGLEVWTLEAEGFTLRARRRVEHPAGTGELNPPEIGTRLAMRYCAVDSGGKTAHLYRTVKDRPTPLELRIGDGALIPLPQLLARPEGDTGVRQLLFARDQVAISVAGESPRVWLFDAARERLTCEVLLEGAQRVHLRATPEGLLVIADDRGRILILDPTRGVPRQLRV